MSDNHKSPSRTVFMVRDLSFGFPGQHTSDRHEIFSGLNLSLREGCVTSLIGANGSGKSTLLNLITKGLTPNRGDIYLRGSHLADIPLRDFAQIVAVVHQTNSVPADISVRRLVGYGRVPFSGPFSVQNRDEDAQWVQWALATTHMLDLADRPVGELSGGQVQRAWLAMALAQGSDIILLDEPTTFLDIRYQHEILELIHRLNKEFGMTVIMVLHDVNQALHYSDEIVALSNGRIVAQGIPQAIVTTELMHQIYGLRLEVTSIHNRPFVLTS